MNKKQLRKMVLTGLMPQIKLIPKIVKKDVKEEKKETTDDVKKIG
jgi:hypothetical protein